MKSLPASNFPENTIHQRANLHYSFFPLNYFYQKGLFHQTAPNFAITSDSHISISLLALLLKKASPFSTLSIQNNNNNSVTEELS